MKILKQTLAASLMTSVLMCSPSAMANRRMSESLPESPATTPKQPVASSGPLIQLAILLDTSGSMKGLVDQARCQVWNAVSRLSMARRNDQPIRLEISVYQYGTEFVSKSDGCLRQIVPFTENLDEVSEALFRLSVAGGDEFCGAAIGAATRGLEWSSDPNVYKTMVIAGNESFFQGDTTLGEVLPQLKAQGIVLNAIYCGTKYKDDDGWDAAAMIAGGRFQKIDHNHHLPNIKTPFDQKMRELNDEMNETFVWFGKHSHQAATNQKHQDDNSAALSDHAFASRMSAKIGHLYHHVEHDLVDAMIHKKVQLAKMPADLMPEALQKMSTEQRMEYLNRKIKDRQSVRRRMADIIAKRHSFLQQHMMKNLGQETVNVFGEALTQALVEQATSKGFQFEESLVSID